ncbi:MAG: M15 family metallopeptidase [Alphaproteobacteria bacterium]|nr:M15 family metallopeptidase [Alphaproteobacteria bacterium]MBU4039131.1 M15 family metallopeptidase [Alphaproteobacteria bacterium]MBU4135124.1 M15 family metallopeptidase [Alphaproteobacteria bacterium]
MGYALGAKSLAELQGVDPRLVMVVKRAIEISPQDFSVHDGLRTEAEQTALVRKGASQTMNSMHRKQADGYGHAVDLVPYINGKLRWEWPAIFPIAAAVKFAAAELNVQVRWGGCWDLMSQIKGSTSADMEKAVQAYGDAKRRAGKRSFPDGPHFEIPVGL